MPRVGVIGPRDLVRRVRDVVTEFPATTAVSFPYRRETAATEILEDDHPDVDAWLFTGVMPFELAADADLLDRPATFVEYSGATLLRAAVEMLEDGRDVSRMSIDILGEDQVRETLTEARLRTRNVHVLPYRPGLTSADVIRFHLDAHDRHGTTTAVTCLRSAYDSLRERVPTLRLAPSVHSVRVATRHLLLALESEQSGDAQVVLGLVELTGEPDALLGREARRLAGAVTHYAGRRHLLVTTRGPLEAATESFSEFPALARLAERYGTVRVGFGVGGTAAEAESLAKRALTRARADGGTAAVVSLRHDVDLILERGQDAARPTRTAKLSVVAQRSGLSAATLTRLRTLVRDAGDGGITSKEVATHLGVQSRQARRVLTRLEHAGVATSAGTRPLPGSGRPLVVYEVNL